MIKIAGAALVLRKFTVSSVPVKPEDPIVEIEGRKPGLISWLLTAMGIDSTTSLIITRRDVVFRGGSIFGEMNSLMPMTAVASIHGGFAKPVQLLIIAGFLTLFLVFPGLGMLASENTRMGGCAMSAIGLLIVAACLVFYWLEKRMALYVESTGGAIFGLVFKRSIIEGVEVDINKVKAVVDLTREMVLQAQGRKL